MRRFHLPTFRARLLCCNNITCARPWFTEINRIAERFVDSNIPGDMDTIMSSIMLVRYDEEVRIREIIGDLIAKKEVKKFKAFTQVISINFLLFV